MSEVVLDKPIVNLTPAAVARVKALIAKQGDPELGLRLGVKGGGCSGLSYTMSLDKTPTDRDYVYEIDGLKVMIDRRSARFLEGASLDYNVLNLLEGGWKWSNPNAQRSCGCGTSFAPKEDE